MTKRNTGGRAHPMMLWLFISWGITSRRQRVPGCGQNNILSCQAVTSQQPLPNEAASHRARAQEACSTTFGQMEKSGNRLSGGEEQPDLNRRLLSWTDVVKVATLRWMFVLLEKHLALVNYWVLPFRAVFISLMIFWFGIYGICGLKEVSVGIRSLR